uniref:Uncharacterized protein n=1 Tax=Moniliophthora roreri TaxID=221103 RepID=A0A0W0G258_MONRR
MERAQLFPNVSPPSTPPPMSRNPFTRTNAITNSTSSSDNIFEQARLSPISGPSNANDLPSPDIPYNPDTGQPYRLSVGHRGQRNGRQELATRAQIKASHTAYNRTDGMGV